VSPKISESPNQEQLAEMIGISVDTLNNYKKLTELIPELENLVDTVIVTTHTALAIMQPSLMLCSG
jgi:predicted TIM-barrel fold metal-dependent hydrolase